MSTDTKSLHPELYESSESTESTAPPKPPSLYPLLYDPAFASEEELDDGYGPPLEIPIETEEEVKEREERDKIQEEQQLKQFDEMKVVQLDVREGDEINYSLLLVQTRYVMTHPGSIVLSRAEYDSLKNGNKK